MWYKVYFVVIGALFAVVLYWQTQPRFAADHFQRSRMMMFCGLTAYGVIPVLHWIYLNGGFSSEIVQVGVEYLWCHPQTTHQKISTALISWGPRFTAIRW